MRIPVYAILGLTLAIGVAAAIQVSASQPQATQTVSSVPELPASRQANQQQAYPPALATHAQRQAALEPEGFVLKTAPGLAASFSAAERSKIQQWFKSQTTRTFGNQNIDREYARLLRSQQRIPQGTRMKTLPPDLASQLGPAPQGYDRLVISDDVALVNKTSGAVADVVPDIM
jgi:hypothetical protein